MIYQWTHSTDSTTYKDALSVRRSVFIEQQGIDPQIEVDGQDSFFHHVVGYSHHEPVCTARVKIENNQLIVQRVAVSPSFQQQGFGRGLMNQVKEFAIQKKVDALTLSAQHTAIPFYRSLGYEVKEGSEHTDAGILHFDMNLSL